MEIGLLWANCAAYQDNILFRKSKRPYQIDSALQTALQTELQSTLK